MTPDQVLKRIFQKPCPCPILLTFPCPLSLQINIENNGVQFFNSHVTGFFRLFGNLYNGYHILATFKRLHNPILRFIALLSLKLFTSQNQLTQSCKLAERRFLRNARMTAGFFKLEQKVLRFSNSAYK